MIRWIVGRNFIKMLYQDLSTETHDNYCITFDDIMKYI